mmetsp:Transcript_52395/g.87094  ORF Transcript_52395/g.87094 Transcript_52395/m.87094 type:complete len:700 (+) Transcript_52395:62-2161(+)
MTFWRPGAVAPGVDLDRDDAGPGVPVFNPNADLGLQEQRRRLPIFQSRSQFLYLVEKYSTVIVVGQTGSGKTTQIPQYLHEAGWTAGGRRVACTQPRRVAATTVAARVAEEMGVELGAEVGYSVRFDDRWDVERTRIKFVTDGMLVRETLSDPLLQRYSVIMLDEAHERSLYTDILLGLLKKVQRKRKDLRLVVSSATLDAEDFRDFFNTNRSGDPANDTAAIISIEGRMYPVDIHYVDRPVNDYIQACIDTVLAIHTTQLQGDVLVFLTGQEEIESVVATLTEHAMMVPNSKKTMQLVAMPMYSGLPAEDQYRVFESVGKNARKVVVATNIAETSITITGIVYVVDSGFVKERIYSPRTGVESLIVTPVSKASAQQRAGRAGRVRSGKCYRLYREDDFLKLADSSIPEMQRTNLELVVLQLKALGIDDILNFDFLSSPPAESMARALEVLYALGGIDNYCKLTKPLGERMAEMPLSPMLAEMLLKSADIGCSKEILTIAAMLSVQGIFASRRDFSAELEKVKKRFAVTEGDHITMLNIYNAYVVRSKRRSGHLSQWCADNMLNERALVQAVFVRKQLRSFLKRYKLPIVSCEDDTEKIRRCIVTGFFAHAALAQEDGTYKSLRGSATLYIHPNSVLFRLVPPCLVYHDLVFTTKHFMRDVTVIDVEWLPELAPQLYEWSQNKIMGLQDVAPAISNKDA